MKLDTHRFTDYLTHLIFFFIAQVPYWLVVKRYWKALIGTCGAWYVKIASCLAIVIT